MSFFSISYQEKKWVTHLTKLTKKNNLGSKRHKPSECSHFACTVGVSRAPWGSPRPEAPPSAPAAASPPGAGQAGGPKARCTAGLPQKRAAPDSLMLEIAGQLGFPGAVPDAPPSLPLATPRANCDPECHPGPHCLWPRRVRCPRKPQAKPAGMPPNPGMSPPPSRSDSRGTPSEARRTLTSPNPRRLWTPLATGGACGLQGELILTGVPGGWRRPGGLAGSSLPCSSGPEFLMLVS